MTSTKLASALELISKFGVGRLIEPVSAYSQDGQCGSIYSSSTLKDAPVVDAKDQTSVVLIGHQAAVSRTLSITFRGANSVVFIGPKASLKMSNIHINGSNSFFYFGAFSSASDLHINVNGSESKIAVGDYCMFSNRVIISNTDGHAIYDISTGSRINDNRDVVVGDHVWIGRDIRVNKGCEIGKDSIIGQGSLATGKLNANCIYGGIPVQLMRENVTWSRMWSDSQQEMEASARHREWLASVDGVKRRIERLKSAES